MSNLILTTEDIYRSFLQGIRKYNTSVIKPAYFNTFINEMFLNWVKSKLPLEEFNQKKIDDIDILRVVTDGDQLGNSYGVISSADPYIFPVPKTYSGTSQNYLVSFDSYPLYLHGLNAMFRCSGDTEWKRARIMRSDKRAVASDNPFRVPDNGRLYFELIKSEIRLIGSTSGEDEMRLEYIRYPVMINYSSTGASVETEFGPTQNQEVVELAIRTFLERITDPRYRSYLQEEAIRSQVN